MKIITNLGTGEIIRSGRYSWGVKYFLVAFNWGRAFVHPHNVEKIILEL